MKLFISGLFNACAFVFGTIVLKAFAFEIMSFAGILIIGYSGYHLIRIIDELEKPFMKNYKGE